MQGRASESVAQLCPTLCDPMDSSPLGSSVHGSLQARMLEWVAIPFPRNLTNLVPSQILITIDYQKNFDADSPTPPLGKEPPSFTL